MPTIVALIALVVGIVCLLSIRFGMRRHAMTGPRNPVMGKWTLEPASSTQPAKPGIATKTILRFGRNGQERVIVWLPAPHHPRPRPVTIPAYYQIKGNTLVQTVDAHSPAFTGLGLAVKETKKAFSVTSRFTLQDDQLTLSQPDSGKSVTLQQEASAGPSTGGPSGLGAPH